MFLFLLYHYFPFLQLGVNKTWLATFVIESRKIHDASRVIGFNNVHAQNTVLNKEHSFKKWVCQRLNLIAIFNWTDLTIQLQHLRSLFVFWRTIILPCWTDGCWISRRLCAATGPWAPSRWLNRLLIFEIWAPSFSTSSSFDWSGWPSLAAIQLLLWYASVFITSAVSSVD